MEITGQITEQKMGTELTQELIEELRQGCKIFQEEFDIQEQIENIPESYVDMELVIQFYQSKLDFKESELAKLVNSLDYLISDRLEILLIYFHYFDHNLYENFNHNVKLLYDSIEKKESFFMHLCHCGNLKFLKMFFDSNDLTEDELNHALVEMSKINNVEILNYLIEKGANDVYTSIKEAILNNGIDVLKYYVNRKDRNEKIQVKSYDSSVILSDLDFFKENLNMVSPEVVEFMKQCLIRIDPNFFKSFILPQPNL